MRLIILVTAFFISSNVLADGACTALATFVGSYKQVSKSCDGPFKFFGPELEVVPYSEKTYSGYWIWSNNMAYGPTTSDNVGDVDKCTVQSNDVLVEISGNDTTGAVLPSKGRISYKFSGSSVAFTADGCTATYSK